MLLFQQRNFILASNSKGATDEIRKMVEEYQDMRDELERLKQDRRNTETELTRLRKQGSFLRRRAEEDHQGNGNETLSSMEGTRSRETSNSEYLQVI